MKLPLNNLLKSNEVAASGGAIPESKVVDMDTPLT